MKVLNHSNVPIYTVAGSSNSRTLPEWLIRKRKRSLKNDPEFANRVDLLQDFEFEEASSCIRVSEDGDWIMSTGTYKPQIHTHYLPHLSLSFSRHTDALNEKFILLSSDYSKSLHLQTDRLLEFHTPGQRHYFTRIPRYGRDLKYNRRSTEALVPCVGVNSDGNGEVYRLNLEIGRFMKAYEVDVGGDDFTSVGSGTLQGGLNTGGVNTAAIAEASHNLLAFGTSLGTIEFWDGRSRSRIGVLAPPDRPTSTEERFEISALEFHFSGLSLASGSSTGLVHLYDLRNPQPLLKKDQGYGYPIQNLMFLQSTYSKGTDISEPKVLSADKRIIKIWNQHDGVPWSAVEPDVDLNDVAWYPDSGMLLTANEGRQQHAFFIPQLGPAPRWCAFLDNIVEEMAEDPNDPNVFGNQKAGQIYDNYKFLTTEQLQALSLDHFIGRANLLRPYMHGYFIPQKLYEEARLIINPEMWQEQRQKSIRQKIDKEREGRIRGNKKISVKVNKRLVERMMDREKKNDRRKAKRKQIKENDGGDAELTPLLMEGYADGKDNATVPSGRGVLQDERFASLFQDEDFEVDETSKEFQALNPSTRPLKDQTYYQRKLTAVEEEEELDNDQDFRRSSFSDGNLSSSESEDKSKGAARTQARRSHQSDRTKLLRQQQQQQQHQPRMVMSSSSTRHPHRSQDATFGSRIATAKKSGRDTGLVVGNGVVGEQTVTFAPRSSLKKTVRSLDIDGKDESLQGRQKQRQKRDRRSASGNTFRRM